jgi:16S rRNA (cytosine967-C5)-methyltransferase
MALRACSWAEAGYTMSPKALLDTAADLLREVLKLNAPSDHVVSQFFRLHRTLGSRERGVLSQTVYEVLRRKSQWQHLAQTGSGPLERRFALLAWQGPRTGIQSALSPEESQWLQRADQVDLATLAEPLRHNLPMWLAQTLKAEVPDAGFWPLMDALNQPATLDLRVNLLKAKRPEAQQQLLDAGIASLPTPYSPWGLRLEGKPALQKLPLFINGVVEVQDEGSQLLALLTGAARGEMVVDFCAGAGGKTLALGAMMRNTGRLYAFDVAAHRLEALKPRLARSGLSNTYLAAIAHENDERIVRLAGKADRVLVDAPCSGVGTLRRNPDLKWRQSAETVEALRERQRSILLSASRLLRPGGRLVYATCSLLQAESESIAAEFDELQSRSFTRVGADSLLPVNQPQNLPSPISGQSLRLWPHLHGTDGFFAAIWQRK